MKTNITGLHHLTAIATDPQANIDFYVGVLGLRLVKKTVNFDDPSAYHLYYGDAAGSPGSILTFFYWPHASKGRVGAGQITSVALSVPADSLAFWDKRLTDAGCKVKAEVRFGERTLAFEDPDGIPLRLVAVSNDARVGWTRGSVSEAHAIRGMHTVEITLRGATATEALLTATMGLERVQSDGATTRFAPTGGGSGAYLDVTVSTSSAFGVPGAGTVHHVAFRVPDDAAESEARDLLTKRGNRVSPVMDRNYFHSIYYREPAGVLFEIATDSPGFAVDEAPDALGTALKLPEQFEHARAEIESTLPALHEPRTSATAAANGGAS